VPEGYRNSSKRGDGIPNAGRPKTGDGLIGRPGGDRNGSRQAGRSAYKREEKKQVKNDFLGHKILIVSVKRPIFDMEESYRFASPQGKSHGPNISFKRQIYSFLFQLQ
jgi:hypothetical protein